MSGNKVECPNCGEIGLAPVNAYYEGEVKWTEWACVACDHYQQTFEVDKDYDPSPEDQEDVTRIGGWG